MQIIDSGLALVIMAALGSLTVFSVFIRKELKHARKQKAMAKEAARYARKRAEIWREPEWNKPYARIITRK